MNTSLVLTIIAEDRPGVVERLAETVAAHEGNWLDAAMARLAGQFAGILRVDVAEERLADLTTALEALVGIQVSMRPAQEVATPERRAVQLVLTGYDKIGIVRDISRELAALGVNVDSLTTSAAPGSMGAEMIFRASAQLHVPGAMGLDEVRERLESIAQDLMVELTLSMES